jgi:hypothetical protein
MVPKYLVERIEAILRGSSLPARRADREGGPSQTDHLGRRCTARVPAALQALASL